MKLRSVIEKGAIVGGKGVVINGDVESATPIEIYGTVYGNVKSDSSVVIGDSAAVYGDIEANCVEIRAAKVQGNITSAEKVILASGSSVVGDIETSRIIVDEGSLFNGKCKTLEAFDFEYMQKI